MELRESRPLPAGLDAPEAIESFLIALVAKLAPGLESSVGAIDWRSGEGIETNWSAEGHLSDGTLVIVTVEPHRSSIELWVDDAPSLKPALPSIGRWTYLGFGGVLSVGFVAGTWAESALWGTLVSVSVLVGWVALDVYFQLRKQRAAREQQLDFAFWRQRFDDAIEFATVQVLRSSPHP
jgi:hypothetical protein